MTNQIEHNKIRAILVTYLRARCDQIDVAGDNDSDGDDDNEICPVMKYPTIDAGCANQQIFSKTNLPTNTIICINNASPTQKSASRRSIGPLYLFIY